VVAILASEAGLECMEAENLGDVLRSDKEEDDMTEKVVVPSH
jgi:hypothetical protein